MRLECPHCQQAFIATTPMDAGSGSGTAQVTCPGCQRLLVVPETVATERIFAAPPMRRDADGIAIPHSQDPPPVDRCFCCGKPVWDGDFVRREIRVGSSTGSAVNMSTAWGGSAHVLGSGSTIIAVNHTAVETVCNECAFRQDLERKREERKARTRTLIYLICLGAFAGLLWFFFFRSSPGPEQSKGLNAPAPAQANEFDTLVGASWSCP